MDGPQLPPPEVIRHIIHECISQPEIWVLPVGGAQPVYGPVEVVRKNNATQAFALIGDRARKDVRHGGPLWGHVYMGVLLPRRDSDLVYVYPTEETAQLVCIKKLSKAVVDDSLARGGNENPYKEIFRQQAIGNNYHVLGCIEALQDKDYLYIITPYCHQGSLADKCPLISGPGSRELQARVIFSQMLEDTEYLHEEKGICHRDIDPGNFLVNNEERILLNDLAMSFRIPENGLVQDIGGFGKPAYLPPEIYDRRDFSARQCDLWACVVTLFNLLTGVRPYGEAHPGDILFRYCIMARGISRSLVNDRVAEVLAETAAVEFLHVCNVAQRIMTLSPQVRELFEKSFEMVWHQRWTREEVLQCEWMNMPL